MTLTLTLDFRFHLALLCNRTELEKLVKMFFQGIMFGFSDIRFLFDEWPSPKPDRQIHNPFDSWKLYTCRIVLPML